MISFFLASLFHDESGYIYIFFSTDALHFIFCISFFASSEISLHYMRILEDENLQKAFVSIIYARKTMKTKSVRRKLTCMYISGSSISNFSSNFSSHFCWRQTYLANVLCGPLEEIQGRFATVTWSRIYFNLKCPLFSKYISLNFFQKKRSFQVELVSMKCSLKFHNHI